MIQYIIDGKSFLMNVDGNFFQEDNFKIQNLAGNKNYIIAYPVGDGVEIYHDNAKKFETLGVGVTVTGATYTTTLETSGAAIFNNDVTSTGTITGAAFAYSGSPTISNNNDLFQ